MLGCCLACGGSAGIAADFSCSNSVGGLGGCAPHALISSGRSIRAHLVNLPLAILNHLVDVLLITLLGSAFARFEGGSGLLILLLVAVPAGLPRRGQTLPPLVQADRRGQEQQQRAQQRRPITG